MASDMFLKLDGINGAVTRKGYENTIEVSSFSWAETAGENAATGAIGRVALHDISFVSKASVASPLIALATAQGKTIRSATLTELGRGAKGNAIKIMTIKLTEAIVSSYSFQGSEANGQISERFALNFQKMEISYYKPQSPTPVTVEISRLEVP
jgi:type VI secretion system secreted protein Hcp